MRRYNEQLNRVAYPLGGIGAGMVCVEGNGMLGCVSIRNKPDMNLEPNMFSALYIKDGDGDSAARVLEGPVPYRKVTGAAKDHLGGSGTGRQWKNYGLPRMESNDFDARFPFASLNFKHSLLPLSVSLTAHSPFVPGNERDSCLPAACLEYTFANPGDRRIEAVYSFHAFHFLHKDSQVGEPTVRPGDFVKNMGNGMVLSHVPEDTDSPEEAYFYALLDDDGAAADTDWYDGPWFDTQTMLWKRITEGECGAKAHPLHKSPGGSLSLSFLLEPGESRSVRLLLAWYAPKSGLRFGRDESGCGEFGQETYSPWHAGAFASVEEVMEYYRSNYPRLYRETQLFSSTLHRTTLPRELMDRVDANLTILKSPTILRQTDGRLWAWEGCRDSDGSCHGSCTHVWNYAQAICHLFPSLERTLRQTEFYESQNEAGHQSFRTSLPIRGAEHDFHAASDGQLGGIMKMYREWRISGDTDWLAGCYDKMKRSLEYCIHTWDKREEGILREPHHNTYDIEFWGADSMCTSFYLGALLAMSLMAEALGENGFRYRRLYEKGREYVETKLFNGEYFIQDTQWEGLSEPFDSRSQSGGNPQCAALLEKEGPRYQYGAGCISDGVVGDWMARACGLGGILDEEKVLSHLLSVYRYNFRRDLVNHANPQRPGYAVGREGGLLLCTWPRGEKPSLPFVYSDEVWTGIEHHVAAHLLSLGRVREALDIEEQVCARYDGSKRNPYSEYECGYWYARALSSYSLLQGGTGLRYDAVDKTLYAETRAFKEFGCFICTAGGYGVAGVKNGRLSLEIVRGEIPVERYVLDGEAQAQPAP